MLRATLLASLVFAAPGCVLGDRHVLLSKVESENAVASVAAKSVSISVVDQRATELKPYVGHTKNGYGMKMAAVLADRDPAGWVEECLAAGLARAGFEVRASGGAPADVQVQVDLVVCYAQAYWKYGGEVSGDVAVTSGGRVLLAKTRFQGLATYGMNWGATASSYQGVLHEAMQEFLDRAVPAIVDATRGG